MSDGALDYASPPSPQARRAGVVAAAVAAAAASAGLAWWLTTAPQSPHMSAPATILVQAAPAPPAPVFAPRHADAEQVRRAYETFQDVYATGGSEALARSTAECEASLKVDRRILDYCLALGLFADAVRPRGPGPAARARRLAMARAALPAGVAPQARMVEVRGAVRAVSLGEDANLPSKPGAARKALPAPHAQADRQRPAAVRQVAARPVRKGVGAAKARAARAARIQARLLASCATLPTVAARTICAQPGFADTDRRLRGAYRNAAAVAQDPQQLAQDQAAWETARDAAADEDALRSLYQQRIRDLEDQTPPH